MLGTYRLLDDLPEVHFVLDCGANVGYSAAYFLSKFPTCEVMAVEPDAGNAAMLQRNLAPYRHRATVVRNAVWSRPAALRFEEGSLESHYECSFMVRECRPEEAAEFQAVDIPTLLRASGHERISILKMDIEGAEAVIFGENYKNWIGLVDNIAIELHDNSPFGAATENFYRACGELFTFQTFESIVVARRRT